MAALATTIGSTLSHQTPLPVGRVAAAASGMAMVLGFGNVVNDLFDIENDRLSKPSRALPSGVMTPLEAVGLASVLALSAMVAAGLISVSALLTTTVLLTVAFTYSWKLKGMPFLGNMIVALEAGWLMPFGETAVGELSEVALLAGSVICIGVLLIESAKAIEDARGDEAAGVKTIAHLLDTRWQKRLIGTLLVVFVLVALLPLSLGQVKRVPLYLLTPLPSLPLWIPVLRPQQWERLGSYVRGTKLVWAFSVLGLLGLA